MLFRSRFFHHARGEVLEAELRGPARERAAGLRRAAAHRAAGPVEDVQRGACAVGIGNRLTTRLQSGYVYSYALVMLLGLIAATSWVIWWAS